MSKFPLIYGRKKGGNATVPDFAPILGKQAFVNASLNVPLWIYEGPMDLSSGAIGALITSLVVPNLGSTFWYDLLSAYGAIHSQGPSINFQGQSLDQESVDALIDLLAAIVSNGQFDDGTLDLSDGNHAPSPAAQEELLITIPANPVPFSAGNTYLRLSTAGGQAFFFDDTVDLEDSSFGTAPGGGYGYFIGIADNPSREEMAAKLVQLLENTGWGFDSVTDNEDGSLTIIDTNTSNFPYNPSKEGSPMSNIDFVEVTKGHTLDSYNALIAAGWSIITP